MRNYIIRRVLLIIPTLFLVSLVVFFTIRLIPGKVVDLIVMERAGSQVAGGQLTTEIVEKMLGLDKPVYENMVSGLVGSFKENSGARSGPTATFLMIFACACR